MRPTARAPTARRSSRRPAIALAALVAASSRASSRPLRGCSRPGRGRPARRRVRGSVRAPLRALARTETRGPTRSPRGRSTASGPRRPARARSWRDERPDDAALLARIADQPTGLWLGEWAATCAARSRPAWRPPRADGSTPVLVAYNIPHRDCGQHSAGGAGRRPRLPGVDRRFAAGHRRRPGDRDPRARRPRRHWAACRRRCGGAERPDRRRGRGASPPAGSRGLHRRRQPGVDPRPARWPAACARPASARARGFAVNVSSFHTTARSLAYGRAIAPPTWAAPASSSTPAATARAPRRGNASGATRPAARSAQAPTARHRRPARRRAAVGQAARRVRRRLQRRPARRRVVARGRAGARPRRGGLAPRRVWRIRTLRG